MANQYDLIIIGGSAAGVSAAVYAARRKLNFTVLTVDIGGEVLTSGEIENYVGFPKTDGVALAEQFRKQLEYNAVRVQENTTVDQIARQSNQFRLSGTTLAGPAEWSTDSVIIATGAHPRLLNVPGEKEFRGKGVTYCTTCDGPLFKGKTVATIGGGNSALESALMLAELAQHVTVLNKNETFKGDQVLVERVFNHPNITVIPNALTRAIIGPNAVTGITYTDRTTDQERSLEVQGVFIHVGSIPNSTMLDFAAKSPNGSIKIDSLARTNVPGLFAAGDVTDGPFRQIAIAAGQGATAALSAISYLNSRAR